MTKPKLCQYGNCDIETVWPIIVSDRQRKERPAFCGRTHAALYLLHQEGHRQLAAEIETTLALKPEGVK